MSILLCFVYARQKQKIPAFNPFNHLNRLKKEVFLDFLNKQFNMLIMSI